MVGEHCYQFQVFQLTTLFKLGPLEDAPRFALNVDRVTINRRAVESAICCIQSYVRNPSFTQRDFFTDYGISRLLSAVNDAGSVCEDSVYDPWNRVLAEGYDVVVRDLKRAYHVVAAHRNDARDTSERLFGVTSIDSSVVEETSGHQRVRIVNFFEVGKVECLSESVFAPQIRSTSYSAKNPAKGKRKRSVTSTPVVPKRRIEFDRR